MAIFPSDRELIEQSNGSPGVDDLENQVFRKNTSFLAHTIRIGIFNEFLRKFENSRMSNEPMEVGL
jgi:hypothetical protein